MSRRPPLLVLVCVLVIAAVAGVAACGSASGPTSTNAPATTNAPTTTTMSATTAAAGATTSVTQADYKSQMAAWVTGVLEKLDTSSIDALDSANVTPAQLDAASAFLDKARAALDQLKAITPPAAVATVHNQFVKAFEDLIAATDSTISALRSNNAADLAAAGDAGAKAQQELQTSMAALGPVIGLTPPSS